MGTTIQNVLLVGATGRLGSRLLRSLQRSSFTTHILTRSSAPSSTPHSTVAKQSASELTLPLPSELPQKRRHQTDYSAESLHSILLENQIDVVVSCISPMPDAIALQHTLLEASTKAQVKLFIPSEWALDTWSPSIRKTTMGIFDPKHALNLELERLGKDGTIDWAAIVNGAFLDMALYDGELDVDLDEHKITIWDQGNARISACTMPFIGTALVSLLERYSRAPEEYGNRVYYISEASFTQSELLAYLQTKIGGEWTKEHTTVQEQLDYAAKCMKSGDIMDAIKPLCFAAGYQKGGGNLLDERDSNQVLGLGTPSLDRAWAAVEEWGRLVRASEEGS